MTVREIRKFGDPVLRTVCEPVGEIDEGVRSLVADLLDTVAFDGRAGLAATQIGFTQRAFSLNIDGEISYVLNPELVEVSGSRCSPARVVFRCPSCGSRCCATRTR